MGNLKVTLWRDKLFNNLFSQSLLAYIYGMVTSIDKNTPTSNLLDIKIGSIITDNTLQGTVKDIHIDETDEFWLFIFYLEEGNQIEIMKIKNIC